MTPPCAWRVPFTAAGTLIGCIRSLSTTQDPLASFWSTQTIYLGKGVRGPPTVLCGGMLSYVYDHLWSWRVPFRVAGPLIGCIRRLSTTQHPLASFWSTQSIYLDEKAWGPPTVLCGDMLLYVYDPPCAWRVPFTAAGTLIGCIRSLSTTQHPLASFWSTQSIYLGEGVRGPPTVLCGGMLSDVYDHLWSWRVPFSNAGPFIGCIKRLSTTQHPLASFNSTQSIYLDEKAWAPPTVLCGVMLSYVYDPPCAWRVPFTAAGTLIGCIRRLSTTQHPLARF
jgi:hypothetical protein